MMGRRVSLGPVVTFLLLLVLGSQAAEHPTPLAAKRSSNPIALTSDGATLLVVNPDSNSLTFVATASHSVLAEVAVGVDPRSVAVLPDGSAATLYEVLTTANPDDEHGVTSHLTGDKLKDLIAFLLALPLGQ